MGEGYGVGDGAEVGELNQRVRFFIVSVGFDTVSSILSTRPPTRGRSMYESVKVDASFVPSYMYHRLFSVYAIFRQCFLRHLR